MAVSKVWPLYMPKNIAMRKLKTINQYSEGAKGVHRGMLTFLKQMMKKHRIKVDDIATEIRSSGPNTYYLLSDRANISAQKLFELFTVVANIAGRNITIELKEQQNMRFFTTELQAIDPTDGKLKTWQGPHVQAISFADAEAYCNSEGMGYLKVTGILLKEVDDETGETIDYSNDN
jgi:hypothetical protein